MHTLVLMRECSLLSNILWIRVYFNREAKLWFYFQVTIFCSSAATCGHCMCVAAAVEQFRASDTWSLKFAENMKHIKKSTFVVCEKMK
jgi:hypothetical protein